MFTLVIGGAASGKSEYAESLILASSHRPRTYIATMQPFDDECRARIEKHRRMRAKKEFETVECYTGLAKALLPEGGAVLLECMSNLTANELYSPDGAGTPEGTLSSVLQGIDRLLTLGGDLVVVTNEVFSGGSRYEGDTFTYLKLLADVNRALAARADRVIEVVSGLPQIIKGGTAP